jgi:hypothetical protein
MGPVRALLCCIAGTTGGSPLERRPEAVMIVRLLGFVTLGCGCVVGRYRDVRSGREIAYVEDKGSACDSPQHRRNRLVSLSQPARLPAPPQSHVA